MDPLEVIVQVGGGGGSISLLGKRSPDGTWRFMRETNESFHATLLSEEDQEGLEFHSREGSVGTFSEGLGLLEQYPWHQLYPLKVHPDFRQPVFDAVIKLTKADGGKNMNFYEWKIECGMPMD